MTETRSFFKSSFSSRRGRCLEVAFQQNVVVVRHSKRPKVEITFMYPEWEAFLVGVKNSEFDIPTEA